MSDKVKVEKGKLSQFRPAQQNANKHTQRGLGVLNKAMGTSGYVAPMTAAADGEVVDGSARLEQAFDVFGDEALIIRHDGKTPIIMVREDIPNALTPEAKRIAVESNRIAQLDLSWDVGQLLADIEAGVKLDDLFNQDELGALLEEAGNELLKGVDNEPPETPPLIDKAEELQQKWQVKPGDVWALGEKHRLICGDCREAETWARLLEGQKVAGVFTSPPYAEQRKQQYGGVPTAEYVGWWEAVQANVKENLAGDGSFFVNIKPHCEDGQRVLYVFDLVLAMVRQWGWRFVDELCWIHNGYPGALPDRFKNEFEPIYHFSIDTIKFRPESVLLELSESHKKIMANKDARFNRGYRHQSGMGNMSGMRDNMSGARPGNVVAVNTGDISHGIQGAGFPVALPTFFIKAFSDPGDLWLDPFAGSGTSIIAAHNEGRIGYGIEKLEKYCSVVLERFLVHTSQQPTRLIG